MIHYPPLALDGRYAKEVFAEIAIRPVPGTDGDDRRASPVTVHRAGSSRGETVRPLVKLELGVVRLWLSGKGRKSLAFNDGIKGGQGLGGGEAAFCFCPGQDERDLTVEVEFHHPHNIHSAKLELFCRHLAAPVCVKRWGGAFGSGDPIAELRGSEESEGAVTKSLPFEKVIEVPDDLEDPVIVADGKLFPNQHLTAARSPYLLRMTISARASASDDPTLDRYAYPTVAWTYVHVLVDSITLSWGKTAMVPTARPDVPVLTEPFLGRGRPMTEQHLATRQQALLDVLKTSPVSANQDVVLNAASFDYSGLATNPGAERTYYQNMWGDGPLHPIVARVKLKGLAGDAVDAPAALGRLRFLWDWEDRVAETLPQRLDAWTGGAGGARNARTTRMTRHFLEKTFERLADARFPNHAFNCPAAHGGKRGDGHPGGALPVFPPQPVAGTFPFEVTGAVRRTWAAYSYPKAGVVDANDQRVDTGVLFCPSSIAGDRYKLRVFVHPAVGDVDRDLVDGAYFDLAAEASQVPHAESGLYTVKRAIKGTYYSTPGFRGGIAATIAEIQNRLSRELGFECALRDEPFPDLQANVANHLDHVVRTRTVFHQGALGQALLLRCAVLSGGGGDPDYAFALQPSIAAHRAAVEERLLRGRVTLFDATPAIRGKEIHGATSGAKAVVIGFLTTYQGVGSNASIAVHLTDTAFTPGEVVNELSAAGGAHTPAPAPNPPLLVGSLTIRTALPAARGLKASSRHVTVRCVTHSPVPDTTLDYPEGTLWATRHLSAQALDALDAFLAQVRAFQGNTDPLTIEIIGVQDSRGRTRVTEVEEYLKAQILSRESMRDLFWSATVTALSGDGTVEAGLERFNRDSISPAWREIFNLALLAHAKTAPENAHWDTEGRAIFYHLRGRTVFDKTFTTGGIENNFCEEKLGLAGLTVPALSPAQRAEKRWLKSPIVVAVHEFGHTLLLTHQLPRHFDTKLANSTTTDHLAHDACIMNYDADTSSFCAYCILRKRGWTLGGLETPALGHPTDPLWAATAKQLMEADVRADANDVAAKARLAMFLLRTNVYLPAVGDQTAQARQLMQAVEAAVPDTDPDRYIWMLRNLVVFFTKVGDDQNKQRAATALRDASDLALDLDVMAGTNAQTLGNWTHTA